jgi:hypothetical protein
MVRRDVHHRLFPPLPWLAPCWLALGSCTGAPTDDTKPDVDTDADADSDSDSDSDSDADSDADTDVPARLGLLVRTGTATADIDGYTGVETWTFTADRGNGALLCQASYALTSTAPRSDCSTCEWAHDIVISGAEVELDEDGACAVAIGADAETIASWNGEVRSYGYDDAYFGHQSVLLVDDGTGWHTSTYADYTEPDLSYQWVDGEIEY